MVRQCRIVAEVLLRLFAAPAHGVDAGIDDQTRGAPGLIAEHAEAVVGRFVHAHVLAQCLAIERPALAISGEIGVSAKGGQVLVFHRQRHLHRMARRGFMKRQRDLRVERAARQVVGVDEVDPRTAATAGIERCDVVRHRLDGEAAARHVAEELVRLAVELLGDPGGAIEQLVRGLGIELRIGAQEVQEGLEVALELDLAHHFVHLRTDARHFAEAGLVDLFRRPVERDELGDL